MQGLHETQERSAIKEASTFSNLTVETALNPINPEIPGLTEGLRTHMFPAELLSIIPAVLCVVDVKHSLDLPVGVQLVEAVHLSYRGRFRVSIGYTWV